MNELKKIELKTTLSTKPIPHSTINRLPKELLVEIFSYLEKKDLQASASSYKNLNIHVLTAVNINEPLAVKMFLNCMAKQLTVSENFPQKQQLLQISQRTTLQHFKNLQQLKVYIQDKKSEGINVVKTLERNIFKNFKIDVRTPHFFDDFFKLVDFERQINEATSIFDSSRRNNALRVVSQGLTNAGYIDRALEVIPLIDCKYSKLEVLKSISEKLALLGDVNRALSIVELIEQESSSDSSVVASLVRVARAVKNSGDFDKAIEILNMKLYVKDVSLRGDLLCEIVQDLVKLGEIDKAISVARSVPENLTTNELNRRGPVPLQSVLFCKISEKLNELGFVDQALEVIAANLEDDKSFFHKNTALMQVFRGLLVSKKIDKAITVAELISERKLYFECFLSVVINLTHQGELDKAIITGLSIPEEGVRKNILNNLINLSIEDNYIDKAIAIAKFMATKNINEYIYKILKKTNDFQEAVESIESVFNIFMSDDLVFRDLSRKLRESGFFEKAVEAAKLIQEEAFKVEVLDDCYFAHAKNLTEQGLFEKSIEIANLISIKYKRETLDRFYFEQAENLLKAGSFEKADKAADLIYNPIDKQKLLEKIFKKRSS